MLEGVVGLSGEHGGLLSYHTVQTSAELTTVSHGVSGSLLLLLPLCHTFIFTSSETKSQQPWRSRVLVLKAYAPVPGRGRPHSRSSQVHMSWVFLEARSPTHSSPGSLGCGWKFHLLLPVQPGVRRTVSFRGALCSSDGCG